MHVATDITHVELLFTVFLALLNPYSSLSLFLGECNGRKPRLFRNHPSTNDNQPNSLMESAPIIFSVLCFICGDDHISPLLLVFILSSMSSMNSTLSSIILRTILVFGPVLRVADEFFDNKLDLAPKRATWQYWSCGLRFDSSNQSIL